MSIKDPSQIVDDVINFGKQGNHKTLSFGTKLYFKTQTNIPNSTFFDYSLDTNASIFNPPERKFHMSCLVDNFLYIYGGMDKNNNYLGDFYKIDVNTNVWTQMGINGTNPGPRARTNMVARNGIIYMVAGATPTGGDRNVYRYTISTNTWSLISVTGTFPATSMDHFVVIHQQWLYVIGGRLFNATTGRNTIYYINLNLANPIWTLATSILRSSIYSHSAIVVGNELFTFFGFISTMGGGGAGQVYDRVTVNTINITTGNITGNFTVLPQGITSPTGRIEHTSRGEFSISKIGNNVYLYGGRRAPNTSIFDGQLSIYDTVNRTNLAWISITNNYLIKPSLQNELGRAGTTMAFYLDAQSQSNLFLFGGFNNQTGTEIVYSDFRDLVINYIIETMKGNMINLGTKSFILNGVKFETKTVGSIAIITMEKITKGIPFKIFSLRIHTPP